MDYRINTFDQAGRVPFDLDGRILFTSEGLQLIQLTLRPGECLPLHEQTQEVIFHLIGGEGTLLVGDDRIPVAPRATMEIRPGILRGWENAGTEDLVLLVIKKMMP